MGAYFLNENLGLLGKIGCAICLIGSVIIVLHAPADEEVESIDQILNLALKPGILSLELNMVFDLTLYPRLPLLLLFRRSFLRCHDLQDIAKVWQDESTHLPLYLLHYRFGINHGDQSLWYRLEDDV